MKPIVLYCKSYRTDLNRVIRLTQSIKYFNVDNIPFYISVPECDLDLFRKNICNQIANIISDDDIISASPNITQERVNRTPGNIAQQIVKSEFWRLNLSYTYLCVDSDSFFIRPFSATDFLSPDGTPYTMLDEGHELLNDAIQNKKINILLDFYKEAEQLQKIFGREGRHYSFGPFPVVWHRDVWQSLDTEFLKPQGLSFADAIEIAPIESRWYGESLLAYKRIKLLPCQPLFKVYHYAWQYDKDRRAGVSHNDLSKLYCGVIFQSSWERNIDWPSEGGNYLSKLGRKFKRYIGKI
jgi:hypothetical protein